MMRHHAHAHGHALIAQGAIIALHLVAIGLAPILMVAGLGMTMSVVLLPFGLFFGVGSVLLLVFGLFEWSGQRA